MNSFTANNKTTFSAVAGLISLSASVLGYTMHPDTIQLVSSLAIGAGAIGVSLIGYFAPDADKVIIKGVDMIKKGVEGEENSSNQAVKEVATDIDTILSDLQKAVDSHQSKIAEATQTLQNIQQMKSAYQQTVTQIKTEMANL